MYFCEQLHVQLVPLTLPGEMERTVNCGIMTEAGDLCVTRIVSLIFWVQFKVSARCLDSCKHFSVSCVVFNVVSLGKKCLQHRAAVLITDHWLDLNQKKVKKASIWNLVSICFCLLYSVTELWPFDLLD